MLATRPKQKKHATIRQRPNFRDLQTDPLINGPLKLALSRRELINF
jgi:hypothetical protein